jgi:hypothetical protein
MVFAVTFKTVKNSFGNFGFHRNLFFDCEIFDMDLANSD